MSKRVAVMYSVDDEPSVTCMRGKKTVILMQTGDVVDVTAVNVEDYEDVCEVLKEALEEATKAKHLHLVSSVWQSSTGEC
jgi:hypothetical protein